MSSTTNKTTDVGSVSRSDSDRNTDRLESSDGVVMDLLRRSGGMRISKLATEMDVTATAVRQRLNRLMAGGLVERIAESQGRGRPSHRYRLTEAGRRDTGSNFVDLAIALWQEIRSIKDLAIRRGLLQRVSRRLASFYAEKITGDTVADRMQSVANMLNEQDIPFTVETSDEAGHLPVLKALGCPYTELAEQDRSICSMERMMFSEMLGQGLVLNQCRLDGESCCTFELN